MIIMTKQDHIHKLGWLVEEGIIKLTNEQSETFQSFLHQNFKNQSTISNKILFQS